jgi:hypothetical protein
MSEFKGTKGKWELFRQDDDIYIETKSGNAAICLIVGGAGLEQDKANALLISKAPEMLDKLKDIKDYLGSDKRQEVEQLIKEATEL